MGVREARVCAIGLAHHAVRVQHKVSPLPARAAVRLGDRLRGVQNVQVAGRDDAVREGGVGEEALAGARDRTAPTAHQTAEVAHGRCEASARRDKSRGRVE